MDSNPSSGAPRQGQRTLTAIVFTDVVGFSARMQDDEERTLRLLERDFADMRELSQQHQGSVLKTTGDGLLLYFASAVQAVACALAVQRHFADIARRSGEREALSHRVGIHLGDVFVSQQDVMGDGVNIASRLQAEAEPGGICISQTVYDVVKNKLELHVTRLGPRELKNIAESIPVYRLLLDAQALNSRATMESTAPVIEKPKPAGTVLWKHPAFRWITAGVLLATLVFSGLSVWHAHKQLTDQRTEIERRRQNRTAVAKALSQPNPDAGPDVQALNRLLGEGRMAAQELRSQYLDRYDFSGLAQHVSRRMNAGTRDENMMALGRSALQMNKMRAWLIEEMQRYTQANPLVTRELSGSSPKELRVFGGADQQLYFVVGGATGSRSWANFPAPLLGAIIVGALFNAETLPDVPEIQGMAAFSRLYGLPEMTEPFRERRAITGAAKTQHK
ncbi:MAG TPA: adenylate/guanylate cyclase domain-containing protein [Candidatus Didemnitutus sp.]|nr:adenylate/guanylate cyclase domain-containing protein [Candidatus Didemnitutus sp.]